MDSIGTVGRATKIHAVDPLLPPKDASAILGIREATLATWRSTNRQRLPFVKVGGRVRYRASDLHAYIEARVRNAEAV